MPNLGRRDTVADDGANHTIQPSVALLRVVDGVAVDEAAPFVEVLSPAGRVERSREGEELFFLFQPTDQSHPRLCRELREIVRQSYWSTPGSVTAALRRSASVANRHLFEHNLNADRPDRCYGGLACAVPNGRDLFLLQAGPAWACFLQGSRLRCFPQGEKLAHVGIGPVADVGLYHVFVGQGDTLLLSSYTLLRDVNEDGLRRVLALGDIDSVAAGLRRVGGRDFVALAARWVTAEKEERPEPSEPPQTVESVRRPQPTREELARGRRRPRVEPEPEIARAEVDGRPQAPARERDSGLARGLGKAKQALGSMLKSGWHLLGVALSYVWHGLAAAGAGVFALGKWLIGAVAVTIRSMLPGSSQATRHRIPGHPPPAENPTIMTVIAAAIPIVILAVVVVAYRQFAVQSRLQGIHRQAEEQVALAQAAETGSEEARVHWEQALEHVEAAATLQPDQPSIQALRDQARQALDRLEGIERLELTHLVDFGSSNPGRQLILHEQTLFVLDAEDGWAAQVPLDEVAEEGAQLEGDGDAEQDRPPVLMHTGQQVGGEEIGTLVDAVWVDGEGGRRSSALLALVEGGQIVSYDPAWTSEAGAPQLSLLDLGSPPPGRAVAVASYEGRFYVLDATADEAGQIWRYRPEGNAYPSQPERYFAAPPPRSVEQAIDMAIDGDVFILYQDGDVERFRGGESQQFETRGVPDGLGDVAGFAVDPEGDGTVYLADRGNNRIVVLNPDGHFKSQLRADPPLASLEALAVSQADRRLYMLDAGHVYAAPLP